MTNVRCPVCMGPKNPRKIKCTNCKKMPIKIELECVTYRFRK